MTNTTFAAPEKIDLVHLDHVIANYNSETDRHLAQELPRMEDRLWADLQAYDEQAGDRIALCDHLRRIALNGAEFLSQLGFDARVAENYRRAMLFSKLGYLHDDNNHRGFGAGGPVSREDQNTALTLADHGREVLINAIQDMSETFRHHPHIRIVMPALMQFRHECVNGNGPYQRDGADMGVVIRVAAITDSYERQFRGCPATAMPDSPIDAIERMCNDAETGVAIAMFDRKLLEAYARFQIETTHHTSDTRGVVREMSIETA